MKLTHEQRQQVEDHLDRTIGTLRCPMCGGTSFGLHNRLTVIRVLGEDDIDEEESLGHVAAACENCAYTAFFNVAQMGVSNRG